MWHFSWLSSSLSSTSVTNQTLLDLFRPRPMVLPESPKSYSSIWSTFQYYFRHPVLFILLTCRSQFDLHLLSFWSTGSTFTSSKISSLLLCSQRVYPTFILKNFISIVVNLYLSFVWWSKLHGQASVQLFTIHTVTKEWLR